MLKFKPLIALLLLLTAALAPTPVSAQSSCNGALTWTGISPDCLSDGDTYRILFITRDIGDATSSNIADYNTFVQAQADANIPLNGVTFNVLGSTATVDARDNTNSNLNSDGPGERIFYYLGRKAADNYADFYGLDWATDEARDQHGQTFSGAGSATIIWTGTQPSGVKVGISPLGGTPGNPAAFFGFRSAVRNSRFAFQPQNITVRYHFYALSDVLLIGMPTVSGTYTASVDEGDALTMALSSVIADEGQNPATAAYRLVDGTTLPPGLTLNTDGSFTGTVSFTATTTATSPQAFPFQWTYTDEGGTTDPQPGTITVTDVNGAPIVSGTYTASLNEGDALSTALSSVLTDEGQEDPADVTYRLVAGETLPAGLTLNTDGSFTGTVALSVTNPEDSPQAFPFMWTYTDGTDTTGPYPGTIIVTNVINRVPVFTAFDRVIFEGVNLPCLCQHVTDPPESQPDPAIRYRYIGGNLPDDIVRALNPDVGSFGQTVFPFTTATVATPAMTYTFQWEYADANGESPPQPATLIVLNNNRAPIIDALSDAAARTVLVDQPVSLTFTGSDPDAAPGDPALVWSITPATPGVTFTAEPDTPETSIFAWTPTEADFGVHDFTVTLSDGDQSATVPLQIIVTIVNGPTATLAGTVTEATLFARQASLAPTVTVTLMNTEYAAQGTLAASHFSIRDTLAGIVRVNRVTRTSDTTATLTLAYNDVDFNTNGTLAVTVAAAGHTDGRVSLITNTIPITASVGVNICGRTPQVRDAILGLSAATECTSVTDLATIGADFTNLLLFGSGIQPLQRGDFDGLTGLRVLRIRSTGLTSLPSDIFRDLRSLTLLVLARNRDLTTLPRGLFAGLTNLQDLDLRTSFGPSSFPVGLRALDADIFDGLDSLDLLALNNNNFMPGGLPEGVFDDVLDTLPHNIIASTVINNRMGFFVDANGRAAHFICSRSDVAAILAFTGVPDCLLVSAAQFNAYLQADATLSGLGISAGALNPAFAPDATTYTVTVPNDVNAVTVTPTATQSGATITVNGDPPNNAVDLPMQDTAVPITIVVTAPNGVTTRPYTIMVTRTAAATATLTLVGTLTEARLFATPAPTVTITLANTEYAAQDTLAASHFTVTDTVAGSVSVSGITRDSATTATLTLGYDNVDITTDGTLAVTLAAAGHTVTGAVTTSTIPITASAGANICGRTPVVRDAILRASTGVECTNINDLSMIRGSENNPGVLLLSDVTTLQRGDFAGLSALTGLQLSNNRLASLPDNVFEGLPELRVLDLQNNNLNTLPANIFVGLDTLNVLRLQGNPYTRGTGLPAGIFDDILDTLAPPPGFGIDDVVRAAHFVCSHPDAARIVEAYSAANPPVTDCLQVTAAQFNAFIRTDTTLSALAVSTEVLAPAFAPEVTTYTVNVANSVERVTVTPIAAQAGDGATITVNAAAVTSGIASNPIDLTAGIPMVIPVIVTAADTTTMLTYTVTVTRSTETAPTARLAAPTALTGATLNTATVTVRLGNTEYAVGVVPGDFSLTTVNLAGTVSVGGVTRTSDSVATLTLAHSGGNIGTDGMLFVTVQEEAHTGAGDLDAGFVPVISFIRGDLIGTVTEDATPNVATGSLTGGGAFVSVTRTGTYGSFTLETTGAWTYRLDNDNQATNDLENNDREFDSFKVETTSGLMETVTITVVGISDIIGIRNSVGDQFKGSVTEDVENFVGGNLQVVCPTISTACFRSETGVFGTYGIFVIDPFGSWVYGLLDSNVTPGNTEIGFIGPLQIVDELAEGQIVTETFDIAADNGATATITITITGTNDPPTAEAGPPQTVNENDPVTLDGGASTDPEDDANSAALAYQWTQTGGMPTVTLAGATTATPTFVVTNLIRDTVLTFTLTVTDSANVADTDTVVITVNAVNNPPIVDAGPPQTVNEGDPVTLAGAATDLEDDANSAALAYQWTQTGGMPPVTLAGDTTATATFTMPDLNANTVLTFTLTVTDSANVAVTDTVTIIGNNDPPMADAGDDQTVNENDPVALDGSGSTDPGNRALTYQWMQTSETPPGTSPVTLVGATTTAPTFIAPNLPENTDLTFTLTVTNEANAAVTDTVTITVLAENDRARRGGDFRATLTEDSDSPDDRFVGTLTARDADHDDNTFVAREPIYLNYGFFSITRNGVWTYILDNDRPRTQSLPMNGNGNEQRILVETIGGTEIEIDIDVRGVNDPPVAEAGDPQTVNEGDMVTLTGIANDPDITEDPTVVWEYTNDMDIVTRLGESPTLIFRTTDVANFAMDTVVTFTLRATDEHGAMGTDTVDITILSVDEPTTISGDLIHEVTDNGGQNTITGKLTVMDPEGEDNTFVVIPNSLDSGLDNFGTFTLARDGAWTYTLDNNAPSTALLSDVSTTTVERDVSSFQGTATATIMFMIAGANDPPVAEAGNPQRVPDDMTVRLDGSDSKDPDVGDMLTYQWEQIASSDRRSGFGDNTRVTLINANTSTATFTPPFVVNFGQPIDEPYTMTFQLTVTDIRGASSTDTVVITLTDSIEDNFGLVTYPEPEGETAIEHGHVRAGSATFQAETIHDTDSGGTFTINTAGMWTFTLDHNDAFNATAALSGGMPRDFSFRVNTNNGANRGAVNIRVNIGPSPSPLASGFTGDFTGTISEDADPNTITGTLTVSNPIDPIRPGTVGGSYGQLLVEWAVPTEINTWTYTLSRGSLNRRELDMLAVGASVTDMLTVSTIRSLTTTKVTITITGINDTPSANAGEDLINVAEFTEVTLRGSGSDPDRGDVLTYAWEQTGGTPTVTLVNADTPTATFVVPDVTPPSPRFTFTLTVTDSAGATDTDQVRIEVTSVNDLTTISGTSDGAVTEDAADRNTAMGTLTISDTDSVPVHLLVAQDNTQGTYGTFSLAAGLESVWTYTLNFNDPETHALAMGDIVTEEFTVQTRNSENLSNPTRIVTITVTGANDAPLANAGPDQPTPGDIINTGLLVTLDGRGSMDPDTRDSIVAYAWTQTGDTAIPHPVSLNNDRLVSPTFTAPDVTTATALTFSLVVRDGNNLASDPDSVIITVNPLPTLSINSPIVDEGDSGTVELTYTVTLIGPTSQTVMVNYVDANSGTATSGIDYTAVPAMPPGQITFAPGVVTRTIAVTVLGDTVDEPDETVVIALSNEANAAMTAGAMTAVGTGTITNDDPDPIVTLAVDPASINEDGGTAMVTATIDRESATPTTITVSPAVAGDYRLSDPSTLTIAAGDTTSAGTVTLTAMDNDVDVADKQVTVSATATNPNCDMNHCDTHPATLTITDNDTAGVTVETGGGTTVRENGDGNTDTYTLVLNTRPTGTVRITPTSSDLLVATVSPSPVVFTTGNWNTEQTVTVIGVNDDIANSVPRTATISHTIRGGGYRDVPVNTVEVTVTNDDTVGLTFDQTPVSVNEEGESQYTVALATQPTGPVTVGLTFGGDLTVAPASLTFTPTNWNTAQTVTVTAVNDTDGDDDTETVTHNATGADYEGITGTVTVTVVDDDIPGVRISTRGSSPDRLDVREGQQNTYTVRLNTQPITMGNVIVTVNGASGDVSVTGSPLTFTTDTWNMEQTITVTAAEDDDAVPDTVTLTHGVTGYDVISEPNVVVTVIENDMAGLTLTPNTLSMNEGVGSQTYTVALTAEPTVDVTIAIAPGGDVMVAPDSLTFTPMNWATAQPVTVTAGEDDDGNDDTDTVLHTASGADEYAGMTGMDRVTGTVTVTVTDNDTPGVFISTEDVALTVNEGAQNTYTVRLATQPTDDVIVTVNGASGDVSVTGSPLTFTTDTWNTDQTITVTAMEDDDATPDIQVTLTHGVTGYNVINRPDVTSGPAVVVTVMENDMPGLTFSSDSVTVDEGMSGSYTVALATEPTANVTVAITAGGDVTPNPASLTFTTNNWNTEQTVTVTAGEDDDGNNDTETVEHAATGADYDEITGTVTVTVTDNDTPSVRTSTTALTVNEGAMATYTVQLNTQPAGNVTVTVGGASDDVRVTGSPLTFTPGNWNTAQPVTVTADEDADAVPDTPVILNHEVTGYGNVTNGPTVRVMITENDMPGLTFSSDSVTVDEGMSGSYTVALATEPTANVTVAITAGGDVTPNPASLTFTRINWHMAQTVMVSAGEDNDGEDDIEMVTHTATGGDYDEVTGMVMVTVIDDDIPRVLISPKELSVNEEAMIEEGENNIYTMSLNTPPTGDVTVTVMNEASYDNEVEVMVMNEASDDNEVGITVSTLTFTTSNWHTKQTVTVHAGDDADSVNDTVILTHGVTGYDNIDGSPVESGPDVVVTVIDNDPPGVTVSPTTLAVRENGGTGTYTLVLRTQPIADVTITPESDNDTVATVSAALTFTPRNWGTAQTVTVTGEDDTIDNPTALTATISHTIITDDDAYNGRMMPFNIDDVTVTTTNDQRRTEAVGIALAVIGRTLATSTVEAISTRFAPEAVTAQATLGGLPCNLPRRQDNAEEPGTRRPPAPQGTECKLSWKSFLARGASFSYALPDTGPGTWMVWGRGDVTNFQGQPRETVSLDGELVSSYVGMDYRQGNRGLIGLALSRSTGEVGYQIEDKAGSLDVELASVYPYIHWSPIKGLGLWGLLGAGRGDATIMHDGLPTLKTDLGMRMAALGVRRELFDDTGGRLALKADALWVEMEAEAAGGTLPVVTGEASRARLALENKLAVHESPNVRMSVRVELGLRVDGGDAEQGLGVEAGGGLEYVLRQPGLTVEASGRTLLAHQAAAWQEWGASVTMRLDPALDGQGLAIALTPVWGQAASGVDALWSRQGAIQTATDAPRPGQPRTAWQPDQMDVELGYGITLPTRRLLTPFGKLGLAANQGRRLQMGMRLGRTGTPQLELIGEQTRAQNNQTPEYRIGMTWSLPF